MSKRKVYLVFDGDGNLMDCYAFKSDAVKVAGRIPGCSNVLDVDVKINLPCECVFVADGRPMDKSKCLVHEQEYGCDECACLEYKPKHAPANPGESPWPRCVCGHIAQEHNKVHVFQPD